MRSIDDAIRSRARGGGLDRAAGSPCFPGGGRTSRRPPQRGPLVWVSR